MTVPKQTGTSLKVAVTIVEPCLVSTGAAPRAEQLKRAACAATVAALSRARESVTIVPQNH